MTEAVTPTGTRSTRVAMLSFLIIMVDGYDTLMISFIAPLLARHFKLAPTDIGTLFAVGYAGAILGALAMGPPADRFGRKPMLLVTLLLAAAATLACAGAGSLRMLLVLRFVSGVALGGALPAVAALTAEHAKAGRRSGTVTLMYIGYPFGAVVGGAITAALLDRGWPVIFLSTGIACLLAAGLACLLPESLRRRDGPRPAVGALFTEQFAEGRLRPALTLWLALFAMLLLTYFLLSWTPSIVVERGGSPRFAALAGVLLNLGGIIGALVLAPVINRHGPFYPIAVLVCIGAAAVALLGQDAGQFALVAVLLAVGFCVLGGQLNFPAMAADLFPAHVRGAGSGWTMAVGRLGSIAGPLIGGVLVAARLPTGTLFLLAAVPALVSAAALFAADRLRRRARSAQADGTSPSDPVAA